MIIFGWGRRTKKVFSDIFRMKCSKCGSPAIFDVIRLTTWFTLFFIPVIPYKFEYYIACTVCCTTFRVNDDNYATIMEYLEEARKRKKEEKARSAAA